MKKTYFIIGWESNDAWAYTHDLYKGEKYGILQTDQDIENAKSFETEESAISKLNYLRKNFPDYGWYILIEFE